MDATLTAIVAAKYEQLWRFGDPSLIAKAGVDRRALVRIANDYDVALLQIAFCWRAQRQRRQCLDHRGINRFFRERPDTAATC